MTISQLSDRQRRFRDAIPRLEGASVTAVNCELPPGSNEKYDYLNRINFSNGGHVAFGQWRLFDEDRVFMTSAMQGLTYGETTPTVAWKELQKALLSQRIERIELDERSGDLIFLFANGMELQVLYMLLGLEDWELVVEDQPGLGKLSNYLWQS